MIFPLSVLAESVDLFKSGDGGVNTFRIPAIATATNGDLIAVADARFKSGKDLNGGDPIATVVRRSADCGKTWTERELICSWPDGFSASDPSLIVDRQTGEVFCFANVWDHKNAKGVYQVWMASSLDNGKTWSKPRDLTASIHRPEWPRTVWGFVTSGSGIQTKDGTLLHTIPLVGKEGWLFGSRDHGKTWGTIGKPFPGKDECKVVELADGKWMVNSRANGGARWVCVSADRGETWASKRDPQLVDPTCNAAILRVGDTLYFANANHPNRRINMTVRASKDGGVTWNNGLVFDSLGAAYSDLTLMKDGRLGLLYETAGYKTIRFISFDPKVITQ